MTYTKEDLKSLYSKFTKSMGRHIYNTKYPGMLLAASHFNPSLFFPSLEKHDIAQDLYSFFCMDFKNLPLYTNSTDFATKAIVNWRLQIGK